MNIKSLMRKVSKSLDVEYNEIINEVDHNLTAGEAREEAVKQLLRKYLPKRVKIDRGFVIDAHGNQSKQIDVIIYDSSYATYYSVNCVKYFPCETVIAVGEIKTDITSKETLFDALSKIESVKKLDRSCNGMTKIVSGPGISLQGLAFDPDKNHRDQIFGFIFSSEGLSNTSITSALADYYTNNNRKIWPNLICMFNQCLISYEIDKALYPSPMEAKCFYITKEEEKKDVLLLFISILSDFINVAHIGQINYFKYGEIDKTSCDYFDFKGNPI